MKKTAQKPYPGQADIDINNGLWRVNGKKTDKSMHHTEWATNPPTQLPQEKALPQSPSYGALFNITPRYRHDLFKNNNQPYIPTKAHVSRQDLGSTFSSNGPTLGYMQQNVMPLVQSKTQSSSFKKLGLFSPPLSVSSVDLTRHFLNTPQDGCSVTESRLAPFGKNG